MRESRIDTTVGIIFILTALSFFVHGTYYKKKFDNLDKETFGFKIRVIGSNISLERFYSDVEPINIIEDLIDKKNKPSLLDLLPKPVVVHAKEGMDPVGKEDGTLTMMVRKIRQILI